MILTESQLLDEIFYLTDFFSISVKYGEVKMSVFFQTIHIW